MRDLQRNAAVGNGNVLGRNRPRAAVTAMLHPRTAAAAACCLPAAWQLIKCMPIGRLAQPTRASEAHTADFTPRHGSINVQQSGVCVGLVTAVQAARSTCKWLLICWNGAAVSFALGTYKDSGAGKPLTLRLRYRPPAAT